MRQYYESGSKTSRASDDGRNGACKTLASTGIGIVYGTSGYKGINFRTSIAGNPFQSVEILGERVGEGFFAGLANHPYLRGGCPTVSCRRNLSAPYLNFGMRIEKAIQSGLTSRVQGGAGFLVNAVQNLEVHGLP
ncbi:MAG: hypothetical protein ACUVRD_04280 [Bacteroidia bacterium]